MNWRSLNYLAQLLLALQANSLLMYLVVIVISFCSNDCVIYIIVCVCLCHSSDRVWSILSLVSFCIRDGNLGSRLCGQYNIPTSLSWYPLCWCLPLSNKLGYFHCQKEQKSSRKAFKSRISMMKTCRLWLKISRKWMHGVTVFERVRNCLSWSSNFRLLGSWSNFSLFSLSFHIKLCLLSHLDDDGDTCSMVCCSLRG